jgi:hypothetical protein
MQPCVKTENQVFLLIRFFQRLRNSATCEREELRICSEHELESSHAHVGYHSRLSQNLPTEMRT